MKLILVLGLLTSAILVLAQDPVPQPLPFDWRNLKNIWERPELQPAVQNLRSRFGNNKQAPTTNGLERIVGGRNATLGQFPFSVLLVIQNSWWCGGSILNANWVLTAAHCLYQLTFGQAYTIVDLDEGYYWTSASSQFIIHEEYDDWNIINDVGLFRLATQAPNTRYTSYISLPRDSGGNTYAGYDATIQGFGVYSDAVGNVSDYKQYVEQTVMRNEECYWQPLTSELCTDTTGGRGPCNGDSGGGLFIGDRNNHGPERYIIGIVSYGAVAGCQLNYPAAFARVPYFLSWIDHHMGVQLDDSNGD